MIATRILTVFFLHLSVLSIAQQPELIMPVGHTQNIFSTQFTPDGRYLLTCAYDNAAKLWETSSGRLINTIENLRHEIGDVVNHTFFTHLSDDGNYVLGLTGNGYFEKRELLTGDLVYSVPGKQTGYKISNIIYGPREEYIITTSVKNINNEYKNEITYEMREGNTGKVLYSIERGKTLKDFITDIDFSSSRNIFLVVRSNSIFVNNAKDNKLLRKLDTLNNFKSAWFTPDGNQIVIFPQKSNILRIWDMNDGTMKEIKVGGKVEFSRDGNTLLAFNRTGPEVIDIKTGIPVTSVNPELYLNEELHFSDDGKYVFLSTPHPMIKDEETVDSSTTIWNAGSGEKLFTLNCHEPGVRYVYFSPDDKYIFTVSDFTVKIWERSNGNLTKTIQTEKLIKSISFSPGGNSIAITTGSEVKIVSPYYVFEVTLKGYSRPIVEAAFSPDGNQLLTVTNETHSKLWDIKTGRISRVFGDSAVITSAAFTGREGKAALLADSFVKVKSTRLDELVYVVHHNGRIRFMQLSNNAEYLVTASDSVLLIRNSKTGELIRKFTDYFNIDDASITDNGEYAWSLIRTDNWSSVAVWSIKEGKMLYRKVNTESIVESCCLSKDGKYLLTISQNDAVNLYEISSGNLVKEFSKGHLSVSAVSYITTETYHNLWHSRFEYFSPDNNYVLLKMSGDDEVVLWDLKNLIPLDTLIGHEGFINSIAFVPGSQIIVTCATDHTIRLWKRDERKRKYICIKIIPGNGFVVSPGGDQLLVVNNAMSSLYRMPSFQEIYQFIAMGENDYFIQLPGKMIYTATRDAVRKLSFRLNNEIFCFEQFDLQYNRPHEIMKALGNTDTAMIRMYTKAWEKRMRRSGFSEKDFSGQLHLPDITILNRKNIPPVTAKETIPINFIANDGLYKLASYNVYANDVPVSGKKGTDISNLSVSYLKRQINNDLSFGFNKVQLSCMNKEKRESLKETFFISYIPNGDTPHVKTYFIGIGIDHFADSSRNLAYSAKDIRDLAKALKIKFGDDLITDTLFNEKVTADCIKKLKKKLQYSGINDKVIIAYSGHGLLSDSLDYYLSTYNINFNNPEDKGLPYEELEDLLDSIPARKKLLLIDACHSGEVDKEELQAMNRIADSLGLIKGSKGGSPVGTGAKRLGLNNSFELMQNLFVNVGRSTGATVISAAAGNQYALEKEDLKNSVFTYCILNAMNTNTSMKVSELKKLVSKRVEELTKGLQKPTSRNEIIDVDWEVW